jgi:hypothetical protein
LSLRVAGDGTALLTLYNASDEPQAVIVSSGLVHINKSNRCNLFGMPLEALPVTNGALEITIAQRQTITLTLE